MSVSVTQISVPSESGGTFFLKVDWVDDLGAGFTVALCDGESAWMGEVSEEEVEQEAQELEMRKESYVKEVQQALTGAVRSGGDYAFQLSPENRARRLIYEKVQRDISFRLGSVELLPCPEPDRVIKELISYGLQQSRELRAQNQTLLEQNHRLCGEQNRISTELERYVQGKESLETELYTRFVLVLNQKKAKIHQLQERLRLLQEQQQERGVRGATMAQSAALEEADSGDSTDEETQNIALSQVSTVLVRDVTSQSSQDIDLSDIPDVAPNRKRRWRHLHGPGSEVAECSRDPRQSGRKDPAHGKAQTNQDTAQESADVATPSTKTDRLFEDF
ncbi:DNA repair protein XRCC4-like isoform X1 [Conger conger]|uniref:DNA repair protein XRCC4-like isoform X1 n=1 Tax=Conger conger TaxID=82655 RepID=UPI002A5984AF|nr:DNA repair protein XRCC4-like isoform X1 [Conger conger]XP_061117042.1 DNA repair protein XRCC4-like isoform X1 [Conger conger]